MAVILVYASLHISRPGEVHLLQLTLRHVKSHRAVFIVLGIDAELLQLVSLGDAEPPWRKPVNQMRVVLVVGNFEITAARLHVTL